MSDNKTLRVTIIEDDKGDGFKKVGARAKAAEKDLKGAGEAGTKAGKKIEEGAERGGRAFLGLSGKIGGLRVGIGEQLKGVFDGIGPGALAAGAVGGLGLAKAFGDALDMGNARAKLTAQLGLTAEDSKKYGKLAGELYKQNYGESFEGVTEAIAKVRQNIGDLGKGAGNDLGSLSKGVLTLSSVFGEDLEKSTGAVGTLLKNGLAEDGKSALDILTRGYQTGANKAGDLADTMIEYPALFKRLGLSGDMAMGLINQGLKAGARNSDLVADSLKEFQIRATDASTLSASGFKLLGLNAKDMTAQIARGGPEAAAGLETVLDKLRSMKDPVKQNAAGVALFGTKWEDTGKALLKLDTRTAVDSLGKVAGAADAAGNAFNTPAARIEMFKRTAVTGMADAAGAVIGWAQSNHKAFSDAGAFIKSVGGSIKAFVGGMFQAFSSSGSADIGKHISDGLATAGAKLKEFGEVLDRNKTKIQRAGLETGAVFMTVGATLLRIGAVAVTVGGHIVTAFAAVVAIAATMVAKLLDAATHIPGIGDRFKDAAARAHALADGATTVAENANKAAKAVSDGMTGAADKLDAGAKKASDLAANLDNIKDPKITAQFNDVIAKKKAADLAKTRLAQIRAMPETTVAERKLKAAAMARQAKIVAAAETALANARLRTAAALRTARINAIANSAGANADINSAARNRNASIIALAQAANAEATLNNTARNRFSYVTQVVTQIAAASGKSANPDRLAGGGTVKGPGPRGVDSVHLLSAPGEEVIRTASADKPGIRAALKYINATGRLPSKGVDTRSTGFDGGSRGGDTYVTVTVQSGVYSVDKLAKDIAPSIKTEINRSNRRTPGRG